MDASTKLLRTLTLSFNLPIYARQIRQWRGAFIEMAGWENDYFHNHIDAEKVHYRYPVIQYRIHKRNAAIFALNEGVDALQEVLAKHDWTINWEGSERALMIEDLRMQEHYLRMCARPLTYKLFKWLPLNQENYQRYQECRNMVERIILLERILGSNLIALCASLDWRLPERLEVSIQHIQQVETVNYHGIPMLAFNLSYNANILLPPQIAIGRSVSHGFGWQQPRRIRKHQERKPYVTASKLMEE